MNKTTAPPWKWALSSQRQALHALRVGSGDQGVPCANGQLPLAGCPRTPYTLGDLAIECTHHNASLAGEPVALTATEQKFLFELSANAGRALTHQQRLQRLWGSNHSSSVPLVPTAVRTPLIRTIPSPRVAEGISPQSLRRAPSSPDRGRPGQSPGTYTDLSLSSQQTCTNLLLGVTPTNTPRPHLGITASPHRRVARAQPASCFSPIVRTLDASRFLRVPATKAIQNQIPTASCIRPQNTTSVCSTLHKRPRT